MNLQGGRPVFFLYALTQSGLVYTLNLSNTSAYKSGSVFRLDHLIQLNVRPYLNEAQVTSVTAAPSFLCLGRSDGCVSCFQPFRSPQEPLSGFNKELRDDGGFLCRWGFIRGTDVAPVRDLSISQVHGRFFMNVLYADGKLRVWDILTRYNILCRSIPSVYLLEVMDGNTGDSVISECFLRYTFVDSLSFSLNPKVHIIPLAGGELRDVRFTSDKIWILMADELTCQVLAYKSRTMETQSYSLHDEHISEQLFLSPASSLHHLQLTTHSLFSSSKDRIMGFISSIFLGRLLCLGIFQDVALRLTLWDYNKHWSDSEFQSLSLDELKSEILLLIEQEVTGETTISVFHWWENFCSCYLDHWRNNNEPRTLLVQSDAISLVRNNSVSLFFEHSLGGPSSEHNNITSLGSGMYLSEHEILSQVLNCTLKISKQLGTASSAMDFESVTGKPVISSDGILSRLVNILESGYAMSIGQRIWPDLGADRAREKELKAPKKLRIFSIDMMLSLSALCQRAGSWDNVFTVMENYMKYLVPMKFRHNNNGEALSDICSSILVQATSQFAMVMFESAFDILLLLSYLLNTSEQVNMSEQDISKLRLKLLPTIQDIVSEWLIILFFVTTSAESTSMDDCSFKPSSLQIDSSSIDKRPWNKMLGKCGFSLAYILLGASISDGEKSCAIWKLIIMNGLSKILNGTI